MSYNLSWMNTTDTLWELSSNTNNTLAGILFNILFFVIYLIVLTQFKGISVIDALISSSFIMVIIGGLLWMIDLVPFYLASIPLWVLVGSLIYRGFSN